jgi:hypothetical protein
MRGIELACAAIVVLYLILRLGARGADRASIAARLLLLACAAWAGEDSVIRAYGFYAYAPGWSVFLDRVPLLIVAIWPVVVDSAHLLARSLTRGTARVAALGGLLVLSDASLIEPIAVRAQLWSWSADNARAIFDVPIIGILGWAYFAAVAITVLEAAEGRVAQRALVVVLAPAGAHLLLVATWWLLFRWLPADLPASALPVCAWALAVPLTVRAWRARAAVPARSVLVRAPGAAFFFVLLATVARGRPELTAYALAFAPPYLALLSPRRAAEVEPPALA